MNLIDVLIGIGIAIAVLLVWKIHSRIVVVSFTVGSENGFKAGAEAMRKQIHHMIIEQSAIIEEQQKKIATLLLKKKSDDGESWKGE